MIADSLDSASRIVMPDCALSIKTCHREKNYHSTYELSSRAERGICSSPEAPPSVSPQPSKGTIKTAEANQIHVRSHRRRHIRRRTLPAQLQRQVREPARP